MAGRQVVLLLTHGVLLFAAAALIWTAGVAVWWRVAWFGIVAAPLLAALPGLLARRRYTLQWLAIVLVIYVAAGVMEVIAAGARLHFATLVLFAALLELALILHLVRREPTTE
jgi:uncharacterized membrane protein